MPELTDKEMLDWLELNEIRSHHHHRGLWEVFAMHGKGRAESFRDALILAIGQHNERLRVATLTRDAT